MGVIAVVSALALLATRASAQTPTKSPQAAVGPVPGQSLAAKIDEAANAPALKDVYAGDIIQPDGTVAIHVTGNGFARMRQALMDATGSEAGMAFTLVRASRTLSALTDLTMRIAADDGVLGSADVELREWGPNVDANTVQVTVTGDVAAAKAVLEDRYGDAVSIAPAVGAAPERLANRYYDVSPFWDGDRIFFNDSEGVKCSQGFAFVGNASGNTFNLTAAHCGGSSVWTNLASHKKIGDISTVYYSDNGFDMESYPCSCRPFVWYEGPGVGTGQGSSHLIAGQCTTCGLGSQVAFDGASTGEVPGVTINGNNLCVKFNDQRNTCHLKRGFKGSGHVCTQGDSGGPVYPRSDNNYVFADGIMVGGNALGDTCWYHDMDQVLPKVNGHLLK